MNASGVAVSHIKLQGDGTPFLSACDFMSVDPAADKAVALAKVIGKLALEGLPVNFVLTPNDYTLLLIEPPEVPEEELKQAVRWKIKEMVDFSVDQAALDIIEVPKEAFGSNQPMVYVVVTKQETVDKAQALVEGAGLELKYVDVAELALCNLMHGHMVEEQGMALLYIPDGTGVINVLRQETLYLTRNVRIDLSKIQRGADLTADDTFSQVLLETQRSLDYYESQLGQPPATKLLFTPVGELSDTFHKGLSNGLGLETEMIDLGTYIEGSVGLSGEMQKDCLLSMAGALREYNS